MVMVVVVVVVVVAANEHHKGEIHTLRLTTFDLNTIRSRDVASIQ